MRRDWLSVHSIDMKTTHLPTVLVVAAACFAARLPAAVAADPLPDVAAILQPILRESNLPSLAAAVVVGEEIRGVGAVGVRKVGNRTAVTEDDKYHIGSCTKMFTATLAAVLVEDGLLTWQTTIGDVLGDKVKDIHAGYENVTLEQLLAHVGGLPENAPTVIWMGASKTKPSIRSTWQGPPKTSNGSIPLWKIWKSSPVWNPDRSSSTCKHLT